MAKSAKRRYKFREAVNVAFNVPEGSQDFWLERLNYLGLSHSEYFYIFDKQGIRFKDPDGLELDLIFSKTKEASKYI